MRFSGKFRLINKYNINELNIYVDGHISVLPYVNLESVQVFLCQFEHNATVFGDQNMKYFPQEFRCSKKILKYFFNIMVKGITTINSLYVYLLDCANYECPGEERVCLLESERCNTVEDCQDGSDEFNCGKLNKLNENTHIFLSNISCIVSTHCLEFFVRCTEINGVKIG